LDIETIHRYEKNFQLMMLMCGKIQVNEFQINI
jgi:hypothetical protein